VCKYHRCNPERLARFICQQKEQLDQKDKEIQRLVGLLARADFKSCENEPHERDSSYGEDQKERCAHRQDGFRCPSCQWNEDVEVVRGTPNLKLGGR
jgi:hypothetical protein